MDYTLVEKLDIIYKAFLKWGVETLFFGALTIIFLIVAYALLCVIVNRKHIKKFLLDN